MKTLIEMKKMSYDELKKYYEKLETHLMTIEALMMKKAREEDEKK